MFAFYPPYTEKKNKNKDVALCNKAEGPTRATVTVLTVLAMLTIKKKKSPH